MKKMFPREFVRNKRKSRKLHERNLAKRRKSIRELEEIEGNEEIMREIQRSEENSKRNRRRLTEVEKL